MEILLSKIMHKRNLTVRQEVHHIQELKEHPELGLDDDNLVSLCTQCHNLRHGRAPKRFAIWLEEVQKEEVFK